MSFCSAVILFEIVTVFSFLGTIVETSKPINSGPQFTSNKIYFDRVIKIGKNWFTQCTKCIFIIGDMGMEGPHGPKGEKGDGGDRGGFGDNGDRGDVGYIIEYSQQSLKQLFNPPIHPLPINPPRLYFLLLCKQIFLNFLFLCKQIFLNFL